MESIEVWVWGILIAAGLTGYMTMGLMVLLWLDNRPGRSPLWPSWAVIVQWYAWPLLLLWVALVGPWGARRRKSRVVF